jgi:uncharacterized protein YcfJ
MSSLAAHRSWVLALTTITIGALTAGPALAGPGKHRGWGPKWDDPGYPEYDYARVVDVDPIVRRVRVTEPRRECYEETRYEYERPYGPRTVSRAGSSSAGSMILGGLIGAAVGNQIGSGDGRRAATVAGAIIGSAIGHDVAARRDGRTAGRYDDRHDDYYAARPYTVERCELRHVESWEERIDGYHVTYEYNGRRARMTLPYDPGSRVRVRVDVRPAEY